MNIFILYIFVIGGQQVVINTQEYPSRDACYNAKAILTKEVTDWRTESLLNYKRPILGVCVPKTSEQEKK